MRPLAKGTQHPNQQKDLEEHQDRETRCSCICIHQTKQFPSNFHAPTKAFHLSARQKARPENRSSGNWMAEGQPENDVYILYLQPISRITHRH